MIITVLHTLVRYRQGHIVQPLFALVNTYRSSPIDVSETTYVGKSSLTCEGLCNKAPNTSHSTHCFKLCSSTTNFSLIVLIILFH